MNLKEQSKYIQEKFNQKLTIPKIKNDNLIITETLRFGWLVKIKYIFYTLQF